MLERYLRILLMTLVSMTAVCVTANAQAQRAEIEALKQQIDELRRREAATQRQLEELQRRIEVLLQAPPSAPAPAATAEPSAADKLEQAVQNLPPAPSQPPTTPTTPLPALAARQMGGATLRLIDLSVDIIAAAGGSTVDDEVLQLLQGGGHDPRKNGFTLQQAELSLSGAVDPYFTGEAHVILFVDPLEGETFVELEEAFVTTQALPFGLEVEAGFFFTEFGLINPVHPHAWAWQDQPLINSRFFGPDGMRQAGLRLGWLLSQPLRLPWYSRLHLGVQNANGETMTSFLANDEVFADRPPGGRPFVERSIDSPTDMVYLARWENAWDIGEVTTKLGGSALFGPNATGADGRTAIYGGDLKVTWRPKHHFRGWPFLLWQTEGMWRHYKADRFAGLDDDGNPLELPGTTLRDWGLYTQLLYGFAYGWAAGVRFEYAGGSGDSLDGRSADPFRADRRRIAPLLAWHVTEFSRLRLQYNYDHTRHLDGNEAHTVWLGFEILYGAHPAHKY